MQQVRRAFLILQFLAALVLAASFAGALHPLGDSLAVFRLQITVGLAFLSLCLVFARGWWGVAGIAIAVSGAISIGLSLNITARATNADLRLYQKNLSFRMPDTGPLVADIQAADVDIVTLQEVSERLQPILTALSPTHPHQASCPFHRVVGDVAIAARHPISDTRCTAKSGMVAVKLSPPFGAPYWAVSIHMHWPFPYRQAEQIDRLIPLLAALDGDVIIGGDFNMVPWGHALRRIRGATGTQQASSPISTFQRFHPLAPLPIDQVLAPSGGEATLRPPLGSDHNGLVANISR